MIRNNSTTYSIAGSLAVHVVFTLGAGSFLMNIDNSVQPQKTYNLEFVKRKTPPLVKKEMIRKEQVRREIHDTRVRHTQQSTKKINLLSLEDQRKLESEEKIKITKEEKTTLKTKKQAPKSKEKKVPEKK